VELDGRLVTLVELAKLAGVSLRVVRGRLRSGVLPADIVAVGVSRPCYELDGKRILIRDLVKLAGISATLVRSRLVSGLTPASIIAMGSGPKRASYELAGEFMTGLELAKLAGVSLTTLKRLLKSGLTPASVIALERTTYRWELEGVSITASEVASLASLSVVGVRQRLKSGETPSEIIAKGSSASRDTISQRCICGSLVRISQKKLQKLDLTSCICVQLPKFDVATRFELGSGDLDFVEGQTFGWATVLRRGLEASDEGQRTIWHCRCVCGLEFVVRNATTLRTGQGCGCRKVPRYEIFGEVLTLAELVELSGVQSSTLYERSKRRGITLQDAAFSFRPNRRGPKKGRLKLTFEGVPITHRDLALRAGISLNTLNKRLVAGMVPVEIVSLGPCKPQYILDGRPITRKDLAILAGIDPETVARRARAGRTPAEIVAAGRTICKYHLNGEPITVHALAARAHITVQTLYRRLKRGMTPEEIVSLGGLSV